MLEQIVASLNLLFNWDTLLYITLGLIIGVWIGAIPGVSGMIAVSIFLIPSYYMEPLSAIIFLTSIYTGSIYGGGVTAVLLNIPGAPGAVATGFDGYAMTKAGRHNEALGAGLLASAFGCFFGYLIVLFLFIPIATLVLQFGPSEMLFIVIFALTVLGAVKGNVTKTFVVGLLGLLLGTVGSSPMGNMRGTFGQYAFYEGIPLVPAILGMLAVSELLYMVDSEFIVGGKVSAKKDIKKILAGMRSFLKFKVTAARSLFVGLFIGLLPAAGTSIASMVSYGLAKRVSANSDNFGKGEIEGVIAAETANNSAEGGSIATMMAFGIPGSGVAAVLMAAFMLHGMTPGPFLIREHMDFAYAVVWVNIFQGVFLLLVGLVFIYYFSGIVTIPTRILVPVITIFAFLGAIAVRGLIVDAAVLIIFGLLGYSARKLDYPILSLILGFMLGKMLEGEFIRTYMLYHGRYNTILERPIVLTIIAISIISVASPYIKKFYLNWQESRQSES